MIACARNNRILKAACRHLQKSSYPAATRSRRKLPSPYFAIISHPDAGKTTLTEKLLLYAGAIELAGAVRGSKTQRHAVSDWMEMSSSAASPSARALEFELDGHHVTLLDTPATRTSAKTLSNAARR